MQPIQTTLLPLAATVAVTLASLASGQEVFQASPFGAPSECQPGSPWTLGLYLQDVEGEQPALRLEGGEPGEVAMLLFAGSQRETALPGGGTLLVGPTTFRTLGRFDPDGVFTQPLDKDFFRYQQDGVLFAQGMQPVVSQGRGMELSGGLKLTQKTEPTPPDECGSPVPPEKILVAEVCGMMRKGNLEAALDLALNSKGDALTLDIHGNLEVPVAPGVTAGGKAAFKAKIQRGEDSKGAVAYDLVIGADVAASAGVGAGVVGAGASAGGGGELIWRFSSTHQVARALRSMLILKAVADEIEVACIAANTQIQRLDRAIAAARAATDRARSAIRSRLRSNTRWANNPLVKKLQRRQDQLRAQRRKLADQVRRNVAWLINWVAEARLFLITHHHGYEIRKTVTVDVNAGLSLGDSKNGGAVSGSNVGAKASVGIEQQMVDRGELLPESNAMAVERKWIFTKSVQASAGLGVGGGVAAKRVIELITRMQMGKDGLCPDGSGTTVKITLDGRLMAALGAFVSGQAAVGGEATIELRLEDLLGYSKDAIGILLGDDEHKAAQMLLAFPIKLGIRGRYEAGFAAGFGMNLDGVFKGGIGASLMMIDRGPGYQYEGGSSEQSKTLPELLAKALGQGLVARDNAGQRATLQDVCDEVREIMAR